MSGLQRGQMDPPRPVARTHFRSSNIVGQGQREGGGREFDEGKVNHSSSSRSELPKNAKSSRLRRSRAELLSFVDAAVGAFNGADFESLTSMLAMTCVECMVVQTCLDAPAMSDARSQMFLYPQAECPVPIIPGRNGISAVLTMWLLLHIAHPDGVMQIIDKRIFHQKVLRRTLPAVHHSSLKSVAAPMLASLPCAPLPPRQEPLSMSAPSVSPTFRVQQQQAQQQQQAPSRPVSIVEAVVKMSGHCITEQSLHELLRSIIEHCSMLECVGGSGLGAGMGASKSTSGTTTSSSESGTITPASATRVAAGNAGNAGASATSANASSHAAVPVSIVGVEFLSVLISAYLVRGNIPTSAFNGIDNAVSVDSENGTTDASSEADEVSYYRRLVQHNRQLHGLQDLLGSPRTTNLTTAETSAAHTRSASTTASAFNSTNTSAKVSAADGLGAETAHSEGKRWRYLLEFRLQFDEHDLLTHWTTTMLAAEPEDVF
jgi:hypothetical protein